MDLRSLPNPSEDSARWLGSSACNQDGSGLVKDTTTGLTWMRQIYPQGGLTHAQAEPYCTGKGMRLPTKDEALAIAGSNYESCAFPCIWRTLTSTEADWGWFSFVYNDGTTTDKAIGDPYGNVLCVR